VQENFQFFSGINIFSFVLLRRAGKKKKQKIEKKFSLQKTFAKTF
jgi:hypothetical protein